MKRSGIWAAGVVLVLLVVGAGVLAGGAGYAEDNGDEDNGDENAVAKCSKATLDGTYLVAYDGYEIKGDKKVPFAQAGYEVYDGNGKVKGVYSANFNGEVFRNLRFPGTYTVKANCTGTSTIISDGVPGRADLFIAPDGSKFTAVQTNPPELVASAFELRGTATRVGD
jgi:hypothetical protein